MSKRRDANYLADIQEAIERINEYTAGLSYEEFQTDRKTQDAVVRNLEIIGEATKNLTADLRKAHPEIPWKSLAGVRDKVIHHYFGLNEDIIWKIACYELKDLLPEFKHIVASQIAKGR